MGDRISKITMMQLSHNSDKQKYDENFTNIKARIFIFKMA